jgi:hypothetical protein
VAVHSELAENQGKPLTGPVEKVTPAALEALAACQKHSERSTDAGGAHRLWQSDEGTAAGLCEAVALAAGRTQSHLEKFLHVARQRRRARGRQPHPPPKPRLHLVEHQCVRQRRRLPQGHGSLSAPTAAPCFPTHFIWQAAARHCTGAAVAVVSYSCFCQLWKREINKAEEQRFNYLPPFPI